MNVSKYLERIHFEGALTPSLSLLHEIHHRHIEGIPFENINNYLGIPVSLDPDALYEKIIVKKRGGYCYELNGLFHLLLLNLGFDARLLPAKLYENEILLEHSLHSVVHVKFDHQDLLLDVGYGSNGQLYPLIMNEQEQWQKDNLYKLFKNGGEIIFSRFKEKDDWHQLMKISLDEVNLSFFNLRNLYHQEDNSSIFKRNLMCSLQSKNFVKSIKNSLFSFTQEENTLLKTVKDDNDFLNVLKKYFAIEISKDMAQALAAKCIKT